MTPDEIEAMVADYRSGIGSFRLARKYSVSESTVPARLKAAGVVLEVVQVQQAERQVVTEEMRHLGEEAWTLAAIGKKFGVTREAVAMRLNHTAPLGGIRTTTGRRMRVASAIGSLMPLLLCSSCPMRRRRQRTS
jgi:hypothetical protein